MSYSPSLSTVDLASIRDARERISRVVHRTPVLRSQTLNAAAGLDVHLKAELFQRSGSHKIRGAMNWFATRGSQVGVVSGSSGNHGQALALAGLASNTPVAVVMPEGSNPLKIQAVQRYGGEVITREVDGSNREATADRIGQERGYTRNRADDPEEVAGFGTIGLEVLEEVDSLDLVLVPVGLGALISGVAIAVKQLAPKVRVVGVEPEIADDARRSLRAGKLERLASPPATVADGVRALSLPQRTFEVIQRYVDDIVTVSEEEILRATWLLWTRTKLVVEPTGALSVAAVVAHRTPGTRAACVLSGGNADIHDLAARWRDLGDGLD